MEEDHPRGQARKQEAGTRLTRRLRRKTAFGPAEVRALQEAASFFGWNNDDTPCIEVAFPVLEDDHDMKKFVCKPEAFVAQKLRKDRVEISEKKLNDEEKDNISAAKWVEVKDWLAEKVVAKLPAHL